MDPCDKPSVLSTAVHCAICSWCRWVLLKSLMALMLMSGLRWVIDFAAILGSQVLDALGLPELLADTGGYLAVRGSYKRGIGI